jgi:hypothetical protein
MRDHGGLAYQVIEIRQATLLVAREILRAPSNGIGKPLS